MRFLPTVLTALAAQGAIASTWFSKAAYNKWHETELERWLSDHDVPYPTPADRKDLEKLIESNWNNYAVAPYNSWDTDRLQKYLKAKGLQTEGAAKANKESLVSQVQNAWYETGDQAQNAYLNVKDWILDGWTDSQLKAFADKHGIPVPQPRNRDSLLQKARANYETIAQKAGETASYPGNWLYETWSESDLKEWLDTHGFPVPQVTSRDKLIASVRRNSRLASLKAQEQAASASESAQQAYATLTDMVIDAWSDSQLKEFADKNGIPVPQGTKSNELKALIRKHRADFLQNNVSGAAASAFGAATSNVGSAASKATDTASNAVSDAFNAAINTWSETRLKGYLDARGVPVPQGSKTDELRALVRKNQHKAASGWSAWTYDDFSTENLRKYLASSSDATVKKVAEKKDASRDELVSAAQSAYSSASSAGGSSYASVTSYLSSATDSVKSNVFDTWSESELKSYLESYGVKVPQGSTLDELRAYARKQYTYFKYGTSSPSETLYAKIAENAKSTWNWVANQVGLGADVAQKKAADTKKAAENAKKQEL
ncbi:meiotic sister chromatid recombination protein 1 [Colletotrichum spaethianum]|uniref:Meiotic sister chromatid recombination protein 1 n=1 Tax=Colletotrichum spaethianum TaxID=700344 RepID=A0AA37URT1_9PEZI|nr:meiotic sister chromatid recombination protein 1 [Colletotrichum spaethianum]GKT51347.1 meiotic sister chromatid recombination protein 1 [Colletotrichum spaethianum]